MEYIDIDKILNEFQAQELVVDIPALVARPKSPEIPPPDDPFESPDDPKPLEDRRCELPMALPNETPDFDDIDDRLEALTKAEHCMKPVHESSEISRDIARSLSVEEPKLIQAISRDQVDLEITENVTSELTGQYSMDIPCETVKAKDLRLEKTNNNKPEELPEPLNNETTVEDNAIELDANLNAALDVAAILGDIPDIGAVGFDMQDIPVCQLEMEQYLLNDVKLDLRDVEDIEIENATIQANHNENSDSEFGTETITQILNQTSEQCKPVNELQSTGDESEVIEEGNQYEPPTICDTEEPIAAIQVSPAMSPTQNCDPDLELTLDDALDVSQCLVTEQCDAFVEEDHNEVEEAQETELSHDLVHNLVDEVQVQEPADVQQPVESGRSVVSSSHDLSQPFSSALTESEKMVGKIKPSWIPDEDCSQCMLCEAKFTVIKRRHHCRACGRVLCGDCCKEKAELEFLQGKVARICSPCSKTLHRVKVVESGEGGQAGPSVVEDLDSAPPSIQSVLKRRTQSEGSTKQVSFCDGVRPGNGGEEASSSAAGKGGRPKGPTRTGRKSKASVCKTLEHESFLPEDSTLLPQIVIEGSRRRMEDIGVVISQMNDVDAAPVQIALKRNLTARVKLVSNGNVDYWNISSSGMRFVGQDDILVVVEKEQHEIIPSYHIFLMFEHIYSHALKGNRVNDMGYLSSGEFVAPNVALLGDESKSGMMFVRATVQDTSFLTLPDPPYLVALLVMKPEVIWAQLLPSRLLHRLGFEDGVYPCPLVNKRNRCSVFTNVGHTVMNLLCDLHHLTYTLTLVRGSTVHVQDNNKTTIVLIPKQQHPALFRVLEGSSRPQHVLAWATDFNPEALSYLGITDRQAHSCVCEDGIRVDMKEEAFEKLVDNLKKGKDLILCAEGSQQNQQGGSGERIEVRWTDVCPNKLNPGYLSPVDGMPLEDKACFKPAGSAINDQSADGRVIRMTEIFVIEPPSGLTDQALRNIDLGADLLPLSRNVMQAVSKAVLPFAGEMVQIGLSCIAIRLTLGPNQVIFSSGAGGEPLTGQVTSALDSTLVQLLYEHAATQNYTFSVEMLLRILNMK